MPSALPTRPSSALGLDGLVELLRLTMPWGESGTVVLGEDTCAGATGNWRCFIDTMGEFAGV